MEGEGKNGSDFGMRLKLSDCENMVTKNLQEIKSMEPKHNTTAGQHTSEESNRIRKEQRTTESV